MSIIIENHMGGQCDFLELITMNKNKRPSKVEVGEHMSCDGEFFKLNLILLS